MRLSQAVVYRLFAGERGRPRHSLFVRAACFAGVLMIMVVAAFRLTPRFAVIYPGAQIAMLIPMLCFAGVALIGLLTDAYQRAFMTKLRVLTVLPLSPATGFRMHVYAQLPIYIIATALIATILSVVFAASLCWYTLLLYGVVWCAIAAAGDIVLRVGRLSNAGAYLLRLLLCAGAVYEGHHLLSLPLADSMYRSGMYIGVALLSYSFLAYLLLRRYAYARTTTIRLPIIEGRLSLLSAFPIRAFRVPRYIGTNVVLFFASLGVAMVAMKQSFIPIDGGLMILLLLIGTLGQEVRTLSSRFYPLELSFHAAFNKWIIGTWLLALVHGLVWIDIGLAIVRLWSPHGLEVGYMYAGLFGLCCIAIGIAAGSIVVPCKYDILSQYASTVLYGLLAWLVIKVSNAPAFLHIQLMGMMSIFCICLTISYLIERRRWLKTIRRNIYAK